LGRARQKFRRGSGASGNVNVQVYLAVRSPVLSVAHFLFGRFRNFRWRLIADWF